MHRPIPLRLLAVLILALASASALFARETPVPQPGYYWGVNGSVARATFNLYGAYRLTGDRRYLDAAFDQVANLYGRNPFGRSFVTGDGHAPPRFPHHRPSVADAVEAPWPGHLVGGPHPTELDWFDETNDAAHNENAINWDGALAFALAIFYAP